MPGPVSLAVAFSNIPLPPPTRPPITSSPPGKRARLDAPPRTPLQMLVSPPGTHSLQYDNTSNSYYGTSERYTVLKNAISIHASDGSASRLPPTNQGYEILSLDDHSNRDWRKKIGEYIGGAFFAKASQCTSRTFRLCSGLTQGTVPERPDEPPWSLYDFPSGYTLSRRRQARAPTARNPTGMRTDVYLYGSTSLLAIVLSRFSFTRAQAHIALLRQPSMPHTLFGLCAAPSGASARVNTAQELPRKISPPSWKMP